MIFVAEHGSMAFGWTEHPETLHVGHTAPDAFNPRLSHPKTVTGEITARELEVLTRVVAGDSNPEIGALLGISADTVKLHVNNVMRKLGTKNRVTAAVAAVRNGLIP